MREILLFVAGVAFFLFGMLKLSSGMQTVFSSRIRQYIRFSVKKPFYGLLTGLLSTIVFQSSSATTLLTMGFVSAGLISFYQSLGIILGADIGTTLTIQLNVWKVTVISPVILFAGITIYFLGKGRLKTIGEMVLYFGANFYGLSLIGDAAVPLKENELFLYFFRETKNPFIGLLIGLVFAAMVHASAIPIGILVILGQQGLITIDNAFPILLGANVGTTATALLGSVATNINGKRSALAHLIFKCCGALICFAGLPLFTSFLKSLSSTIAQQISFGHFFSNLFIVIIFIGFLKPFSTLMEKIIPGKERPFPLRPEFLDRACLSDPAKALVCVRKELGREIMLAQKMLEEALKLFHTYKPQKKQDIMYIELVVDNLQAEITEYLWYVSRDELSPAFSKKLFAFSSFASDIERVGDHSTNLAEIAELTHRRGALFSEAATGELRDIGQLVIKNLAEAALLIERKDVQKIRTVIERERGIDVKIKNAVAKHLESSTRRHVVPRTGPFSLTFSLTWTESSDHCKHIAQLVECF
jgi:phosphate:Na+ symporter